MPAGEQAPQGDRYTIMKSYLFPTVYVFTLAALLPCCQFCFEGHGGGVDPCDGPSESRPVGCPTGPHTLQACTYTSQCGNGRDCLDGRCYLRCVNNEQCPVSTVCGVRHCVWGVSEPTTSDGGVCDGGTTIMCQRSSECPRGQSCLDARCVNIL
jgi:hypothetical protein